MRGFLRMKGLAVALALAVPMTWLAGCAQTGAGFVAETSVTALNHQYPLADGAKIHVLEKAATGAPSKDVVVLLHSAGIDLRMWDCAVEDYSFANFLATHGKRVYAIDYRGFGGSSPVADGRKITIASTAADVTEVIRQIAADAGVSKVSIYGTSVGAIVGARVTSEHPELVARLAMTGGFYNEMAPEARNLFPEEFFLKAKDGMVNYNPAMMAKFMPSAKPEVIGWYQETYPATEQFPGGLFINFWHLPVIDKPARITVPVLLVNGDSDVFTQRDDALRFLSSLGTKELNYVELQNTGHAPLIEGRYHEFRRILLDFLNKPLPTAD